MSVLVDYKLIDDHVHHEPPGEYGKNIEPLVIMIKVVEPGRGYQGFTTTHFWCRTCKEKYVVADTRMCDCGMIMCVSCWAEWEETCPICDAIQR
ncbi:hypothetical protein [Phosphitispora sp. TUW77]|uniref:hypothetical protein n=1 Tax=Phosphitispora sp. TUW77 TaxID=3152361 RepID=UPI003AB4C155